MSAATVRFRRPGIDIAFDSASGEITSLVRPSTTTEFISVRSHEAALTIAIGTSAGSDRRLARPASLHWDESEADLQLRVRGFDDGTNRHDINALVRVSGTDVEGELAWDVTVENADPSVTVLEVAFPRLTGLHLGSDEHDALFMPNAGGERLRGVNAALRHIASDRTAATVGARGVASHDTEWRYELPYIGPASMPWMAYVGGADSLYLGAHDPQFASTRLRATTRGSHCLDLELAWPTCVHPTGQWTSPQVVLALGGGDWHEAADRYRRWFDNVEAIPGMPDHWAELTAMWLPFMKVMDGRVRYRFPDIPDLARQWSDYGFSAIAPYGWSEGGFDTYNPSFYPDLELGGRAAMVEAYTRVRDQGIHLMGYLNARIFNHKSHYFPMLGARWRALAAGGEEKVETYGPGGDGQNAFAVVCPAVQAWQDLLVDFAEQLAAAKVDLIYFDQVALAPPVVCYDEGHGHPQGTDSWNRDYRLLLAATAERTSRYEGASICIEGCGDAYARYAPIQSSAGVLLLGTMYSFPELFKYTFPEVLQADLLYCTAEGADSMYAGFITTLSRDDAREWLIRGILVGSCFGVLDQNIADAEWWDEAQVLLSHRIAAAPLLAKARFRDTVDLVGHASFLDVRTFALPGEGHVLLVHNRTGEEGGEIVLSYAAERTVGQHYLPDGSHNSLITLSRADGTVRLEAPADALSVLVVRQEQSSVSTQAALTG